MTFDKRRAGYAQYAAGMLFACSVLFIVAQEARMRKLEARLEAVSAAAGAESGFYSVVASAGKGDKVEALLLERYSPGSTEELDALRLATARARAR